MLCFYQVDTERCMIFQTVKLYNMFCNNSPRMIG
ncbi:hypothetical protein KBTX_04440 [wastewater metagenome]|uniref:Uncharacterized protein n=2 Tax=unclassified sequences TaxID=12908 RepID=A0A5B8RK03_9ZZZZ|nr:hypothetical protein KBTEX_04440 [uncultured organism]